MTRKLHSVPEHVTRWEHHHLGDFGDLSLSDAGDIELSRKLPLDLVLSLGRRGLLSISSIPLVEIKPDGGPEEPLENRLYVLRNLTAYASGEQITIDVAPDYGKDPETREGFRGIAPGTPLTIGKAKDATPDLQLPGYRHARIIFGEHTLHIRSLEHDLNTDVYINPETNNYPTIQQRSYYRKDPVTGKAETFAQRIGKWDRTYIIDDVR